MADLIDRTALGIGEANREVFENPAYADGRNSAIKIIKAAPSVDAIPVRHGKWKLIGADKKGRGGIWKCAGRDGCGKTYPYQCDYCPNCGARMEV